MAICNHLTADCSLLCVVWCVICWITNTRVSLHMTLNVLAKTKYHWTIQNSNCEDFVTMIICCSGIITCIVRLSILILCILYLSELLMKDDNNRFSEQDNQRIEKHPRLTTLWCNALTVATCWWLRLVSVAKSSQCVEKQVKLTTLWCITLTVATCWWLRLVSVGKAVSG